MADLVPALPPAENAPPPAVETTGAPPPVDSTPAAAPAAPEQTPATETAAAGSAPAAAPATERTPSLLETAQAPGEKPADKPAEPAPPAEPAKPPEGEKPADAPPAEDEKPPEAAAAEPPAEAPRPPPLEYKYDLPEGLELNDDQRTELHGVLDAYRADPSNLQPLVDYHHARMNELAQQALQYQQEAWNTTQTHWRQAVMEDEQLGGAGHRTAMATVARMRDLGVSTHPIGSEEWTSDARAFTAFLDATGAGNHPVFLRFLHNMARFFDEAPPPPSEIKPAPQPRPARGAPLYDNPRSNLNGRE